MTIEVDFNFRAEMFAALPALDNADLAEAVKTYRAKPYEEEDASPFGQALRVWRSRALAERLAGETWSQSHFTQRSIS
jgi:hypothetical protein